MNTPSPTKETATFDFDLSKHFLPNWATDSPSVQEPKAPKQQHDRKRSDRSGRPSRPPRRNQGTDRNQRGDNRNFEGRRNRERPGQGGRPPFRRGNDPRNRFKDRKFEDRQKANRPQQEVSHLSKSWKLTFVPDPHGIDALCQQIKSTLKAYPLFDLCRLIVEKPGRYNITVKKTKEAEAEQVLFQCKRDSSLWLTEAEAVEHLITHHLAEYYRTEKIQIDPPKGNFISVGQCGLSGEILGPTNHHDYQTKIRHIHSSRYPHMPIETYKSRIRILKDEESINKWKEQQSWKEEFYPLNDTSDPPVKLASMQELRAHFIEHYLQDQITRLDQITVSGTQFSGTGSKDLQHLLRHRLHQLRANPVEMLQLLSNLAIQHGLHVFKAHGKITYIAPAQPHKLDPASQTLSTSIEAIIQYIRKNPKKDRSELINELIQLNSQEGLTEEQLKEIELKTVNDFVWLIHQGYIIDYAASGVEAHQHSGGEAPSGQSNQRSQKKKKQPGTQSKKDSSDLSPENASNEPLAETPKTVEMGTESGEQNQEPSLTPVIEPALSNAATPEPEASQSPEEQPETQAEPQSTENPEQGNLS